MSHEHRDSPVQIEQRRHRSTLAAAVLALVLLGVLVWVVQWIVEQQRMERCLASRRPDCFRIETPPREAPAELKR